MRLDPALLPLISLASASALPSWHDKSAHEIYHDGAGFKIPTVHESAVLARRILDIERVGTLSTVFPTTHATENRPSNVGGSPIGLPDYFANCEPDTGNPTILELPIATSFKNVQAGSNISLSLRWHAPYKHWYSVASVPRFNLVGYLEEFTDEEVKDENIAACFVKKHPDAATWLPGNRIHVSKWVRLVVQEIYWIGGFGDRAYIGWIPLEEWQSVSQDEIEKARLPGEDSPWSWRLWFGLVDNKQEMLEL
ncbi:hypothetical protein DPSP01_008799 [Paraphaeosphaeria sporulosa]|uniref:CREG-like beta-barrel domain-containing protein n=1 Tax=Paraphaeosphaeria sporulosa TaxID=1460663 RepID=A0A177CC77_9PLEO|nr:uncharacterized protein CC84DRAFT_1165283 [Paraphaeosphaeria sporulosa]OAG04926.1 hypothetical protein CC84DRAFT_1165283 [Paraphaeosphaeria sporulosa]